MVDVKHKRCQEADCTTRPIYNYPNETKAVYCKKHAKAHMVNVKNKWCQEEDCTTHPSYNYPNETKAVYCKKHAKADMVDVMSKRCQEADCTTHPSYNYPNETKAVYCAKHAKADMVDVKHKRCQHVNRDTTFQCVVRAGYGLIGLAPTRCASHTEVGMIFNPKRRCESCTSWAQYSTGSIPQRCEQHKTDGDADLVLYRCSSCFQPRQFLIDAICPDCDNRPRRTRLRKQRQVKCHFDGWIRDGMLPQYECYDFNLLNADGCGRERPDFVFDGLTFKVIVEVDEDQHRTYVSDCEIMRMKNITQALGMPCIWIRYNPDHFKGQTASLRDCHRLDQLSRVVRDMLQNPCVDPMHDSLRVGYLYYDHSPAFKLQSISLP
jgi:hypothetical protein